MSGQKVKLLVAGGLAVALITGLVLLNQSHQRVALDSSSKSKETGGDSGKDSRSVALSDNDGSKNKVKSTSDKSGATTNSRYGLPELTMENVDINPERPADMPLADWEEYERQRYEMVQLKAYKFRQTDPTKVVPVEIAKVLPEAAKKYGLPEDLLKAILFTSSDGGHHDAEHDIEGGYGCMMLKESPQCDTLGEAAALLGKTKEELIYNQELNILGGAAVIQQYYEDAKASGMSDAEAYYMACCAYTGRPQPVLAQDFADKVAGYLLKGFESDSADGSGYFDLQPNPNPLFYPKNWKAAGVDPPPGYTEQASAPPPPTTKNPQAVP